MKKNIHICNWVGRLGNNINQVLNALQIALYYNYNVLIPEHKYFNKRYIVINNKITIDAEKITDDNNFFYINKLENIEHCLFRKNLDDTLYILRDLFTIQNSESLHSKSVVIHIKSGDILGSKTHAKYMMPPLSYYTDIINKNKYKRIWLVAEDIKNPCVNKLLQLYPNIIFNKQRLTEDIELILEAQTIIESFGSFVSSLLLISENIKTIYRPSYHIARVNRVHKARNFTANIVNIDLQKYLSILSPWRNTKKQKNLILNYE